MIKAPYTFNDVEFKDAVTMIELINIKRSPSGNHPAIGIYLVTWPNKESAIQKRNPLAKWRVVIGNPKIADGQTRFDYNDFFDGNNIRKPDPEKEFQSFFLAENISEFCELFLVENGPLAGGTVSADVL